MTDKELIEAKIQQIVDEADWSTQSLHWWITMVEALHGVDSPYPFPLHIANYPGLNKTICAKAYVQLVKEAIRRREGG